MTSLAIFGRFAWVLNGKDAICVVMLVAVEVGVCAVAGSAIATAWGNCSDIFAACGVGQGGDGLYALVTIDADASVDKERVVGRVAGADTFR